MTKLTKNYQKYYKIFYLFIYFYYFTIFMLLNKIILIFFLISFNKLFILIYFLDLLIIK